MSEIMTRAASAALIAGKVAEDCAICLTKMDANNVVSTYCGHKFHSQCLVDSLQHDRRCPVCRHDKKSGDNGDNDDLYESGAMERVQDIIVGRLTRIHPTRIRTLLQDFDIPGRDMKRMSDSDMLVELANQLCYETDNDDEEEGDEEEENQVADYPASMIDDDDDVCSDCGYPNPGYCKCCA